MKRYLKYAFVALLVIAFAAVLMVGAGTEKVANVSIPAKIKNFDPSVMTDLYTTTVASQALEGLYQYKYLSDIYELEPCIAAAMPTYTNNGLTITIPLRKDVYFYDPEKKVFKEGKGRNVKASDVVYAIMRIADPQNTESGGWWLYDGYVKGLNEWVKAATDAKKADYNAKIEGVKAVDDYTFQLTLTKPYPQIMYTLAMSFTYLIPKEMVDVYKDDWSNHLIGTGPYFLDPKDTIADNKYVLKRNPAYRDVKYPNEAGSQAKAKGLLADAGKKLPFIDTVIYRVFEETNPQWLAFMNGDLDASGIPKDQYSQAITPAKDLTPELAAKGIILDKNTSLDVTYTFFNMEDPILGKNKKLRQAMSLAQDGAKTIDIFYNGRAIQAQTVIPPGLGGYDPNFKNPYLKFDVEAAKKLLADAGYPGGNNLPELTFTSLTGTTSRQMAEFFKNNMAAIGVKIKIDTVDWPTFLSLIDNHKVQIGGIAWGADYPDAQNFLQLLYGPNAAPNPNAANYSNPDFDKLYDQFKVMFDSPQRSALYSQAAKIAVEDCPWILGVHRMSYSLFYKWYKNVFYRDIGSGFMKYRDIDLALKAQLLKKK